MYVNGIHVTRCVVLNDDAKLVIYFETTKPKIDNLSVCIFLEIFHKPLDFSKMRH